MSDRNMDVDPLLALDWQRALRENAVRDLSAARLARRDAKRLGQVLARRSQESDQVSLEQVRAAASKAHEDAKAASARLRTAAELLRGDLAAHVRVTPEQEVARLDASLPIALLPVRIETRFRGDELLLRVYPDAVFGDTHEPELTDQEIADATAFWNAAWAGEDAERDAWRRLVDALGVARAAWVAQASTPVNIGTRPQGVAQLPVMARRAAAWTRAPEARLLPDRWMVLLYRGGALVKEAVGPAIVEPLALTFAPATDAADRTPLTDDGLEIDEAAHWTVDFGAAEAVGMALRIALDTNGREQGFDRVLVLGVKSSFDPQRSAAELAALFANHRYGRGVGLVRQGTPTNNTADGPAGLPVPDPDASRSFDRERRPVAVGETHDGGRLAAALGLDRAAVQSWEDATHDGDGPARAMLRALWPVTLGYFMDQMMAPVFDAETIAATRRFVVEHVRGRGPIPALRIGNTPYGVLPVSTLAAWRPSSERDRFEAGLVDGLRRLRPLWLARSAAAPRIGAGGDPDEELLTTLGMDAAAREVRVRTALGEDTYWNLFGLLSLGADWPAWQDVGQRLAFEIFSRIGRPDWAMQARISRMNFGGKALPFRFDLVAEEPLSETASLVPNYIDWIAKANVPALRAESLPDGKVPTALLYRLLRHAALLEYHDVAFELLLKFAAVTAIDRREDELVGIAAKPRPTRMARLDQPLAQVSGEQPLHAYLHAPQNRAVLETLVPDNGVLALRKALGQLAPLPTAELERLFTESMDVAAHRIDAWITGLVSRRLGAMRERRPDGIHLAAYGWVENLQPKAPGSETPVKVSEGRTAVQQADNGGFIHAPSMTHASAMAVLRNAHMSRRAGDPTRYAVDLSSSRVRLGRFILDAVREGQPLGAVLGYRVESGLHERRQDVLIDPLRALYPLVAKKSNEPADLAEPTEQIAARNVVDGLALRRAQQEARIPWGASGLPAGGPGRVALEAELAALDAAVDAVSDLLLGESVYQLVKGSTGAAAATLDAMAQGTVRPPDPEIATQPRRGTPLTHRVAVVLGEGAPALPPGWPAVATVRAAAEPMVDAWLGAMFGDPRNVTCKVECGPPDAPVGNTTVALSALALRPIDVYMLARGAAPGAGPSAASELDRRVQQQALANLGLTNDEPTRITYALDAGADRTTARGFIDIIEIARAVQDVFARSRPLAASDLLGENASGGAAAADLLPAEALARADAVRDALDDLRGLTLEPALQTALAAAAGAAFDLTDLRNALEFAARGGLPTAFPLSLAGDAEALRAPLVEQARSVLAELSGRLAKADAALADARLPANAGNATLQVETAVQAVAILLGAEYPFLPAFRPADAAELTNAIGHAGSATFIDADAAKRAAVLRRFEMGAARVRPAVDGWRRLGLLRHALGVPPMGAAAVQLPFDATARWAALPFANADQRPKAGRTSILIHRHATPAATARWSGLMLDKWTEFIPETEEQTGVAFHYDDPGAEAPQAILLAIPPEPAERWRLDWLVATLNETLDLAKIRAVDSELLGELGQVLPAIYLADSTDDVTVQTKFFDALAQERTILFTGVI
jgi:hypothetical protein